MPREDVKQQRIRVVVVTTVMLSFISFWRAAAIVLNDLGSSAYYAGGIAEQAVGPAAPWFVLGIMLFSYAVRAVYIESCSMFTRGGVYRVVKEAMGGTLAKLSVSALMFDYILTGPISGVSAGQYIVGLFFQVVSYAGYDAAPNQTQLNYGAAVVGIAITLYFWRRNIKGIHESSTDALRIMRVASVMVVVLVIWSGYTILTDPEKQRLPPLPISQNLTFNQSAVGWLPQILPDAFRALPTSAPQAVSTTPGGTPPEPHLGIDPSGGMLLGLIGILIAFGHSFLAMSGEESLAQVNRELEYPKHKNLMRAGFVIFAYSLLFTALVSFFAYALIPDDARPQYYNNLISGISLHLAGSLVLKIIFQAFIVVVGFLMLAGAVNTSLIGANGVLNRVSEDGVLTAWFRAPHKKFGTSSRLINLIAILQLVTIVTSQGNIYLLGEAYAFGVIWSFAFKALAMVILRFKDKRPREWKVPLNLRLDNLEIPFGLAVIAFLLFSIAGINLLTKEVATVSGVVFTLVFFSLFLISERINHRRSNESFANELDQFGLEERDSITNASVHIPKGGVLCLVHNYHKLAQLDYALKTTDTSKKDLIVLKIKNLKGHDVGVTEIHRAYLFTDNEQLLFTKVVAVAEKYGKHVDLLVIPSSSQFHAIARTAADLHVSEIILGRSSRLKNTEVFRKLSKQVTELEERPEAPILLSIVDDDRRAESFMLETGGDARKSSKDGRV